MHDNRDTDRIKVSQLIHYVITSIFLLALFYIAVRYVLLWLVAIILSSITGASMDSFIMGIPIAILLTGIFLFGEIIAAVQVIAGEESNIPLIGKIAMNILEQ